MCSSENIRATKVNGIEQIFELVLEENPTSSQRSSFEIDRKFKSRPLNSTNNNNNNKMACLFLWYMVYVAVSEKIKIRVLER